MVRRFLTLSIGCGACRIDGCANSTTPIILTMHHICQHSKRIHSYIRCAFLCRDPTNNSASYTRLANCIASVMESNYLLGKTIPIHGISMLHFTNDITQGCTQPRMVLKFFNPKYRLSWLEESTAVQHNDIKPPLSFLLLRSNLPTFQLDWFIYSMRLHTLERWRNLTAASHWFLCRDLTNNSAMYTMQRQHARVG